MRRSTRVLSGIVLVLVGALAATTLADALPRGSQSEPRAVVGTGFTYQGRVEVNGVPYTGICGFDFSLWDAAASGNQIGSAQGMSASVTNGAFSVLLNHLNQFGSGAFSGDARWLETKVRCPNTGPHTLLGRTQLTPVPYATFAMDAADSERLGGMLPEEYASFARVVIVRSGQSNQENGDALLAAIAGITDASGGSPVVVLLDAGTYVVDTTVVVPSYVTLSGLGRGNAIVTGGADPVVELTTQSTIAEIKVEAGATGAAVAVLSGSAQIRSAEIRGASTAIRMPAPVSFSLLTVTDSVVAGYCTGAVPCYAFELAGSAQLRVTRTEVSAAAFAPSTMAMGISSDSGSVAIMDSNISVSGIGAIPAIAVRTESAGRLDVIDSGVNAYSSAADATAISTSAVVSSIRRLQAIIYATTTATGISTPGWLELMDSDLTLTGTTQYGVLLLGLSSQNLIERTTINAGAAGAGSPALQSNGDTTVRNSTLIASPLSSSIFVQSGVTVTSFTGFAGGSTFSTGVLACTASSVAGGTFLATGCP